MEYALSLQPASIAFNLLQLLPGTPYFLEPERFGILHGDLPNFLFLGTEQMPPKDLNTAIYLGAFIRSCFVFPVLRGFFPNAVANELHSLGKRPVVIAYQRVQQQMLEAGLPQDCDSNTGSREYDLYQDTPMASPSSSHNHALPSSTQRPIDDLAAKQTCGDGIPSGY